MTIARRAPPSRRFSSRKSLNSDRSKSDKPRAPPLKPWEMLMRGHDNIEGMYNTMEVFNTIPSMYTEKKWQELQAKRRCDLNFEHLYWLSRFDPQNQDGHHLQNLINSKIGACRDNLRSIVIPMESRVSKICIR